MYTTIVEFRLMPRKKLDRYSMHSRVAADTPEKLKEIACKLGYVYNNEGSTGQLLDAIVCGEIILVVANKSQKSS